MKYTIWMLLAGLMLAFAPAYAALVPGDACTTSGQVANSVNAGGAQNVLWCNGTTWQSASIVVGNSVATCDATTKGTLKYDGNNAWSYCNGTAFVPFNAAAGTAKIVYAASPYRLNPTAGTCTPPSCPAGYTSQGCQWGEGNYSVGDGRLAGKTDSDLSDRTGLYGYTEPCVSHIQQTPTPNGEYNQAICARLCVAN